jgi:CheY-like chemotaxis protein
MTYTLEKAKILIVDDMKPMLDLTQSVLKIFGFQNIETAMNGEDGFKTFCSYDPDVVVSDWMMEPVNGLEFTQMIRKNPLSPNPYVPIILMTGFSSRFRVEQSRDKGITEFLVKPFASRDLYTRLSQIIEKPRQFVDADGFFGPDRRRKYVKDYQGPRRRDDDKSGGAKDSRPENQNQNKDILKKLKEEAKSVH